MKRKFSTTLFLLFLTLGLSSCSSVKMGWNFFETLVMYNLDDYFDLPSKEEVQIKEKIAQFKKEDLLPKLPVVVDQLDAWTVAINGEALSVEKAEQLLDQSHKLSIPLLEKIAQESSSIVVAMNEKQRGHLVSQIDKRIQKKEKLSQKEVEKKIEKRYRSNMDRFFGRIEDNQKNILASQQKQTVNEQKGLIQCQREALKVFKEKLRGEVSELNSFINDYFVENEKIHSENCQKIYGDRKKRWAITLSELQPTLSLKQKKYFQAQMLKWQADLRSIYQKETVIP